MECKCAHAICFTEPFVELIDTLWNVNVKKLGRIARGASELIDTLWNVNDCPQEFYRNFHTSN